MSRYTTSNFFTASEEFESDTSVVSDVKPEELAKMLEEPVIGENPNEQKHPRKKTGFGEFNEDDPLGDLSLSDSEFCGNGSAKTSVHATVSFANKLEDKDKDLKGGDTTGVRSKVIADLFGLNKDNDVAISSPKPAKQDSVPNASDWLGLTKSPKKVTDIDVNLAEQMSSLKENNLKGVGMDLVSREELTKVEPASDDKTNKNKADSAPVTKAVEIRARKTVQNVFKEEDASMLLEAKLSRGKEAKGQSNVGNDLFKDLFKNTGESKRPVIAKEELLDVNTTDTSAIVSSLGAYMPSVGTARRPGFGRRRGSAHAPSMKRREDDIDGGTTGFRSMEGDFNLTQAGKGDQHADTPTHVQGSHELPSWLSGMTHDVITSTPALAKHFEDKRQPTPKQNDSGTDTGATFDGTEHKSSSAFPGLQLVHQSENPVSQSAYQPEVLLSPQLARHSVVPLVQQLTSPVSQPAVHQFPGSVSYPAHQIDPYLKHSSVHQSFVTTPQPVHGPARSPTAQSSFHETQRSARESSGLAEGFKVTESAAPLTYQMDTLIKVLMSGVQALSALQSQPVPHALPPAAAVADSNRKSGSDNETRACLETEARIRSLEFNIAELELKLKHTELSHESQLKSLELSHAHEILLWTAKEERLRRCLEEMDRDFTVRINRMRADETELVRRSKERIEQLQQERLADLRQLGEFHQLAIDQVAILARIATPALPLTNKAKELFARSRGAQKPAEERDLGEWEAELRVREKELSTMAVALSEGEQAMEVQRAEVARAEEGVVRERRALEELRERVMREQGELEGERMRVAMGRARLGAVSSLRGPVDLLQAQAELSGAVEGVREVEGELEVERKRLREVQRNLGQQRLSLEEMRKDIALRERHLQQVLKISSAKQEESQQALHSAAELASKSDNSAREISRLLAELKEKEEKVTRDRVELTRERMELNRRRAQLDVLLPELTPEEAFSINSHCRIIEDPKMKIVKLKAEREMETLAYKWNECGRDSCQ